MSIIRARLRVLREDRGASTAEYALCMLVGVSLAGALLKVVTSEKTQALLTNMVGRALT